MAAQLSVVPPMTPWQALIAFEALSKEIGSKCRLLVGLNTRTFLPKEAPLEASAYTNGLGHDRDFTVEAETFEDLLTAVRAKWAEHSDKHARHIVRDMALEIIRITDDQGECTDAALRAGKFTADDVERHGLAACAKAAEMAAKGPFAIVTLGGANSREDAA